MLGHLFHPCAHVSRARQSLRLNWIEIAASRQQVCRLASLAAPAGGYPSGRTSERAPDLHSEQIDLRGRFGAPAGAEKVATMEIGGRDHQSIGG